MSSDNPSILETGALSPHALYRGLYVRVARKLRVDPSYVSRVARGERQSDEIERALHKEIDDISRKVGNERKTSSEAGGSRPKAQRLRKFLKQNRTWIRQEWMSHVQADPNMRRIKVSNPKRTGPILPLIDEATRLMKLSPKELATLPLKAGAEHGRRRRVQGYTPSALVEDYNLIRRCVFSLAEKNIQQMDYRLLLHDLAQLGEALDLQLQRSLQNYLGAA